MCEEGCIMNQTNEKPELAENIKNEYCIKHNIPLIRIPYTHYENLKIEDLLLNTTTFKI